MSCNTECEEIRSSLDEGVLHISLNRQAKKNALTMPMFSALSVALSSAQTNSEIKAIVLSGKGDCFTAGHDLQAFSEWPQSPSDPVPQFLYMLAQVEKPLVIAVHGAAMGIGATILLHADWVCCTADATLCFPFINLGICPEAGSSLLLSQAVGLMRAKRLLMSGEIFSGTQAYDWGLVSEIVEMQALLFTSTERARMLAEKSTASFRQIKTWMRPPGTDFVSRIDAEVSFINDVIERRAGAKAIKG